MRELVPNAGTLGLMVNDASPATAAWVPEMLSAAGDIGQKIEVASANTSGQIDAAFEQFDKRKVSAIFVGGGALYNGEAKRIVALAARYSIPAMYSRRAAVMAGGLISYDSNVVDIYFQAGVYAARILMGERPSDLPVMQPTKFELVLNLKTAKALQLNLTPKLLALADEVIE
jgi:putative tryptophan/tyrosine transport system substrate-binding protein